jgi:hypothetical protein
VDEPPQISYCNTGLAEARGLSVFTGTPGLAAASAAAGSDKLCCPPTWRVRRLCGSLARHTPEESDKLCCPPWECALPPVRGDFFQRLGNERCRFVSEKACTARGRMQARFVLRRGHYTARNPPGTQRFDACQRGCLGVFRTRPERPLMGSVDNWRIARPISSNWRYPPVVDAEQLKLWAGPPPWAPRPGLAWPTVLWGI